LLATPFETFEQNIRDQLGRALKDGGFDAARDITAVTVNLRRAPAPRACCAHLSRTPATRGCKTYTWAAFLKGI
jgi:hypothetical protein